MSEEMTTAEVTRSLIRIEAKLDKVTGDHEARLRRVEQYMWAAIGAGGLGAVTGLISLLGGG